MRRIGARRDRSAEVRQAASRLPRHGVRLNLTLVTGGPASRLRRRLPHARLRLRISGLQSGPADRGRRSRLAAKDRSPVSSAACPPPCGGHPPSPIDISTGPLTSSLAVIGEANQNRFERTNCVRDEEAAGSNPATPTQVTGHLPRRDVAFSYAVQQQSTATPTSQAASRAALRLDAPRAGAPHLGAG
jgi:hypothetical protein